MNNYIVTAQTSKEVHEASSILSTCQIGVDLTHIQLYSELVAYKIER